MEKHTKVYLKFFPSHTGFYHCEVCHSQATEIHHIKRRSEFGSKTKDQQDKIENLIALCRTCHELAHANKFTKEYLTKIHLKTMKSHES